MADQQRLIEIIQSPYVFYDIYATAFNSSSLSPLSSSHPDTTTALTIVAACDWRVIIDPSFCNNAQFFKDLYWVTFAVNSLALISGVTLFSYRYFFLKQKMFDVVDDGADIVIDDSHSRRKARRKLSDYRPRPVEHFVLWTNIHFFLKVLYAINMATYTIKSDLIDEFLLDFSWSFAAVAVDSYLVGMIYMIP
ncbi:hypothetical protein HDV05_006025, partial [Chytridiales sp. JEL 0842]